MSQQALINSDYATNTELLHDLNAFGTHYLTNRRFSQNANLYRSFMTEILLLRYKYDDQQNG